MAKQMNFPFAHPHCVVLSTVAYSHRKKASTSASRTWRNEDHHQTNRLTSHTRATKWREWKSLIETFKIIKPFFFTARETRNDRTPDSTMTDEQQGNYAEVNEITQRHNTAHQFAFENNPGTSSKHISTQITESYFLPSPIKCNEWKSQTNDTEKKIENGNVAMSRVSNFSCNKIEEKKIFWSTYTTQSV